MLSRRKQREYNPVHLSHHPVTKYPLTPLHKDAVIGGLERFDYFRRGCLNGSLLML